VNSVFAAGEAFEKTDHVKRIKIRRRTKCQNRQQNIMLTLPNITSTQLAIIRKQPNTMRPAITRKPRTTLMSHMDIIYMQFIITRKQQNPVSSITTRSRTFTTKKPPSRQSCNNGCDTGFALEKEKRRERW
jgi:hypothetical protein